MWTILKGIICSDAGFFWQFFLPILHFVNFPAIPIFLIVHLFFWLAIFLPIMKHDPYFLNSNDGLSVHPGRAFGFTFLIYYITVILLMLMSRQLLCTQQYV